MCSTSVVTIARLPYLKLLKEPDVLYVTNNLNILSVTELGIGITATSAGTLRPLFVKAGIPPISGGSQRFEKTSSWRQKARGWDDSAGTTNTDDGRLSAIAVADNEGGTGLTLARNRSDSAICIEQANMV